MACGFGNFSCGLMGKNNMRTIKNVVEESELAEFASKHLDIELAKELKLTEESFSFGDICDKTIYTWYGTDHESFDLEDVSVWKNEMTNTLEWRYLYSVIELFMIENNIDEIYLDWSM